MRNTKRELNPYSFYDTEGLARHFERMAAEGWAPDRVGLFIRYRRIKPQKLRFAVAFYPDSDDTPEGEDVFIDYCEQAGWQHAVGAGALTFWGGNVDGEGGSHSGRSRHVFCTADENAVEIDTDPVLQVDATHRGLKPYCHWLVAFSVLQLLQMDNIIDDLQSDPLSVVSSNLNIRSVILQVMIIIICAAQLIGYYRWYGKAKQVAEEEGRFLAPKSRPWLQTFWRFVLLVTFFSAFAIGLFGSGSSGQGRLYYAALLSIAAPIAAAFFAHSSMERAGAGRKKRRAVTVIALVLAALASTGLLYTMKQNGLFESQQATWNGTAKTVRMLRSITTRCHFTSLILAWRKGRYAGRAGAGSCLRLLPHSAAECRKRRSGIQTRTTRTSIAAPKRGSITRSATYTFRLFLTAAFPLNLTIRKDTRSRRTFTMRSTPRRGTQSKHGGSITPTRGNGVITGCLCAARASWSSFPAIWK